jgi:4-hydroxythreonine-4-phosphate dehydrogenase
MGEPAGIGPEVAVAAYTALGGQLGRRALKLVGDPDVFHACGSVPDHAMVATKARAVRSPAQPRPDNAAAVLEAIEASVRAAEAGAAGAIVTSPINKAILKGAGFAFPGHTEFLAHLTGTKLPVMMLAGAGLRVVPLTIHLPVVDVPGAITTEGIVDTARIVLAALRREFAVAAPRLAVCGLNPHAGEDGVLGREEKTVIEPAIARLRREEPGVFGPLAADTLFRPEARVRYDAALCMYHDQALIPIKMLAFWEGVNITLGLPVVRTSPDHGTAFDIAGTGKADPRSMMAAIRQAGEMADARSR